jgi:hypothetical protein
MRCELNRSLSSKDHWPQLNAPGRNASRKQYPGCECDPKCKVDAVREQTEDSSQVKNAGERCQHD